MSSLGVVVTICCSRKADSLPVIWVIKIQV